MRFGWFKAALTTFIFISSCLYIGYQNQKVKWIISIHSYYYRIKSINASDRCLIGRPQSSFIILVLYHTVFQSWWVSSPLTVVVVVVWEINEGRDSVKLCLCEAPILEHSGLVSYNWMSILLLFGMRLDLLNPLGLNRNILSLRRLNFVQSWHWPILPPQNSYEKLRVLSNGSKLQLILPLQ